MLRRSASVEADIERLRWLDGCGRKTDFLRLDVLAGISRKLESGSMGAS
jgi:hypothetical protein